MSILNRTFRAAALIGLTALLAACDGDDPTGTTPDPVASHKYLVHSYNPSDQSSFLTVYDSLPSGSLNNTVGAKQLSGVFEVRPFGKYCYTGANALGEPGIQKYGLDETGRLKDMGYIYTGSGYLSYGIVSETKGYYWDQDRGRMKLQIFNPTTMARTGEIDLSSLSKGDPYEAVAERLIMPRDGKLFVDVHYCDNTASPLANDKYDTGYVAVIDIATDRLEKMIKRPGVRGLGYVNLPMWDIDEKGDAYIISLSNFVTPNPDDRDSKIVRIPKGSTEFDQNWEIALNDYQRGGFFTALMVRNGKIYTFYPNTPIAADFANFNSDIYFYHIIDVGTKVSTPIAGVPAHNFVTQGHPLDIDGKIYIPVSNSTLSGYYRIEGTSAKEVFRVGAGGVANMLIKLQ